MPSAESSFRRVITASALARSKFAVGSSTIGTCVLSNSDRDRDDERGSRDHHPLPDRRFTR